MENNSEQVMIQQPTTHQPTESLAFPVGNDSEPAVPKLDLGRRVEIAFLSMGYRSLKGVSCTCKNGRAVLTGRTKSFYEKQVAQVIASKVAGVTGVENLIEVDK